MVQEVKTKADFDAILNDNPGKLVVVDFSAQWCGPCKMIQPIFQKMSEDYGDVVFLKVDVDENSETAEACGISCMPTFKFYKGGQEISEMQGANAEGLKSKVEEYK